MALPALSSPAGVIGVSGYAQRFHVGAGDLNPCSLAFITSTLTY